MTETAISPRVHALVALRPPDLENVCGAQPDWVSGALQACPWTVVRRAVAPEKRIAVGVRGESRSKRWGGFARKEHLARVLSPHELRFEMANAARSTLPAMQALRILEKELSFLRMPWGPGGSVAHELASGQPVVRKDSDLDLVIYADHRIDRDFARDLYNTMNMLPAKMDARIENAFCGFALQEYVQNSPQYLVRTQTGPKFVGDPWSFTE